MRRYMLDTNAVNHALKQHPAFMEKAFMEKLIAKPMAAMYISAVTRAEIAYGLAKHPDAVKLHKAVAEFFEAYRYPVMYGAGCDVLRVI